MLASTRSGNQPCQEFLQRQLLIIRYQLFQPLELFFPDAIAIHKVEEEGYLGGGDSTTIICINGVKEGGSATAGAEVAVPEFFLGSWRVLHCIVASLIDVGCRLLCGSSLFLF